MIQDHNIKNLYKYKTEIPFFILPRFSVLGDLPHIIGGGGVGYGVQVGCVLRTTLLINNQLQQSDH
jgi:hypothetical protein